MSYPHSRKALIFFRSVASILIFSMLALMYQSAYAQTIDLGELNDLGAIGRDAQGYGKSLADDFNANEPWLDGSTLNLGNGESINVNDLYPGTSADSERPNSYYFPDEYEQNTEVYAGAYDSGSGMDIGGGNAQSAMYSDAIKEDPDTVQGEAYKIIMDTANRSRQNFTNDPIAVATRGIVDDFGLWEDSFGDCSTETRFHEGSITGHIPEYETCERVMDKSMGCEMSHDFDAGVVEHHSGPLNLESCGEGCMYMWIGKVGDNYWSGWCDIYEEQTAVRVINPDAITKAELEYVEYDDYLQVWVGPFGQEVKIFNGPNDNFPPETAGECELSTSWREHPNIEVTDYFKNASDDVVNFRIRVSVGDVGEGYGRIRIYYDPEKAILKDEWGMTDPDCPVAADAIYDKFASGQVQCLDMPELEVGCNPSGSKWLCTDEPINPDHSGCSENAQGQWLCDTRPDVDRECADINGVLLCTDMLENSPSMAMGGLCRKAAVSADFTFYKGNMGCWEDAEGNPVCHERDVDNETESLCYEDEEDCENLGAAQLDNCAEYEDDPSCGFVKSECIDGAKGMSNQCYVYEDTFDCGYDVDITTLEKEETIECAGEIKCLGLECLDIDFTQNERFAEVAALFEAAQFMAQDMECTGIDEDTGEVSGEENVDCKVFPGKAMTCKKAVGGVVNCCKKPKGVSLADYIAALKAVPKIDAAIMGLSEANTVRSAYQSLRDPVVKSLDAIKKPFTSATDGISGTFSKVSDGVGAVKEKVMDGLKTKAEEILGTELATKLGSVITFIGWAYTIYSIAKLLIEIIYKCTKKELELNVQRELKACHHVGSYCRTEILGLCIEKRESYCCFSSPLSRILQEQIRLQTGRSWGSPKSPDCGAMPIHELQQVNWDEVDLSEWLAILQSTGHWPDEADLTIENLTGMGSALDLGERVDAEERTMERLDGIDVDAIRNEIANEYKPYPVVP